MALYPIRHGTRQHSKVPLTAWTGGAGQGWSRGEPSSGAECGRGEPSPGADVAGVRPVPVQMWQGAQQTGRREIAAHQFEPQESDTPFARAPSAKISDVMIYGNGPVQMTGSRGSPRPHLHQDSVEPCHICAGTEPTMHGPRPTITGCLDTGYEEYAAQRRVRSVWRGRSAAERTGRW